MRDCISNYHITLYLVCFSLYSIADGYKQFWTLYAILEGCIQLIKVVYKSRNL